MEVWVKLVPNKWLVPGMCSRKLDIQLQDGDIGEAIVLPAPDLMVEVVFQDSDIGWVISI